MIFRFGEHQELQRVWTLRDLLEPRTSGDGRSHIVCLFKHFSWVIWVFLTVVCSYSVGVPTQSPRVLIPVTTTRRMVRISLNGIQEVVFIKVELLKEIQGRWYSNQSRFVWMDCYEFRSFSPSVGERKPKCSTEHPSSGLNCSTVYLHKGLPALVPLEVLSGCLQVMKLSGKEAFKGVTCLGHEATEFRVRWAIKHRSGCWDLMCPNGSVTPWEPEHTWKNQFHGSSTSKKFYPTYTLTSLKTNVLDIRHQVFFFSHMTCS